MAEVIDYLRDQNNDLYIINGDFVKGDATRKHTVDLVVAHPGAYAQHPTTGVGASNYLNNDDKGDEFKGKVIEQLELDGQTVTRIKTEGSLVSEVSGEY